MLERPRFGVGQAKVDDVQRSVLRQRNAADNDQGKSKRETKTQDHRPYLNHPL